MSWAKFDDRYDDNRKVKRAWRSHPRAVGLHAMAVTYSARHETDGLIDIEWLEDKLPSKVEREKCLVALLKAGLFERVDEDHFRIHDYLDYNDSKDTLSARREEQRDKKRAAGRKGGQEKWRRERITQQLRQTVAERLGAAPGGVTTAPCSYCSTPITIDWSDANRVRFFDADGQPTPEIDHIDALARGGAHSEENLTLACLGCNRKKGTRSPSSLLAGARTAAVAAPGESLAPDPTRPDLKPPNPQGGKDFDDAKDRLREREFTDWLADHSEITGHSPPRVGTKALAAVESAFSARRGEGYGLDDLKLASRGAHADDYRRENGYDNAESVLRPTKIHNLIERGRRAGEESGRPSFEDVAAAAERRDRELEERRTKAAVS